MQDARLDEIDARLDELKATLEEIKACSCGSEEDFLRRVRRMVPPYRSLPNGKDQLMPGSVNLTDGDNGAVGKVLVETVPGPKPNKESWYIQSPIPFSSYDPTRAHFSQTQIDGFSPPPLPSPPSYTRVAELQFAYTEVPDPSSAGTTPSTASPYRYDVYSVNAGGQEALTGALYRLVLNPSGTEVWFDAWVLYESYVPPQAGTAVRIKPHPGTAPAQLSDFLTEYYQNPGNICGSSGCTYAQMDYSWVSP